MPSSTLSDTRLTFSGHFGIHQSESDDWFDPCLALDSPLCVDPFLMLDLERDDEFRGAHDEILAFFGHQLREVAAAGTENASRLKRAAAALRMPEAGELCLGYSKGTKGAGSGEGLARVMVRAMQSAIAHGLSDVEHFEEISILGQGIGPDRISDATAGLTKWRFARYTERICASMGVPLVDCELDRARYDTEQGRWITVAASLPVNPNTGRAVLLTPKRFLRHLPTLGSDEFDAYAERRWRHEHRDQLDRKLVKFDRDVVLQEARESPELRKQFLALTGRSDAVPYDFVRDPWGMATPKAAERLVAEEPFVFSEPADGAGMMAFVVGLAEYFKHYIEHQKGYELLWDGNKPKPEKAIQRLLFGVVFLTCRAHNVSVDPEANAGLGPVDFKFSRGFSARCLLEAKRETNSKWLKGVASQLRAYLVADLVRHGVYLLVSSTRPTPQVAEALRRAASSVKDEGLQLEVVVVDASRNKLSASKR